MINYKYLLIPAALFALYKGSGPLIDWASRRFAEPPAPPTPEGVTAFRDVEYTHTPQGPLLLDVFVPEPPSTTPLPVLIHIFGGGWKMGNKHQVKQMQGLYYAQQGYAVVSINYRKSDVATFPAQIHDCKAAVRWVRKNAEQYNFDPNRIGVYGTSGGGHSSALIGTSGDVEALEGELEPGEDQYIGPVQAVVDFYGPTDFPKHDSQRLPFAYKYETESSVVTGLLGGLISNNMELARQASPITYVKPGMPPLLIIHGTRDRVVAPGQSQIFHDALQKSGNESELLMLEGKRHTSISAFTNDEITARVKGFFDQHLQG